MAKKWSDFTRREKILGVLGSVFGVIVVTGIVGAASNPTPQTSPTASAQSVRTTEDHKPVVTTKDVVETSPIPFGTTTVNDASKAKGISTITTVGVNGVQTKTYTVTYSDGAETGRVLKSNVVTTAPVTQVTTVGTYVAPAAPSCSNGTYVNSAGNTVCSPETSPTVPAGATAKCYDGTYSFSQSRSGTCSHHGGVAQWL